MNLADKMDTIIQLKDVPSNSKIYTRVSMRVNSNYESVETVIIFKNLDGMFSYCFLEEDPRRRIHLSVLTPLEQYKDGYRMIRETANKAREI